MERQTGRAVNAAAAPDKRGVGPVRVLKPEDLMSCKTLSERMSKMVENRCEVFIHNVAFLCKKHKLSQARLCAEKLDNIVSPPQLTGYKNRGRDIPISVMALVASAFHLTIEEMCGQLLDESSDRTDEDAALPGRPMEEYLKYVGAFDMAYFDTGAAPGRNDGSTAGAMSRAVLSVYVSYNAIGTASFHVTAIFNCTPEERQKIANYMEGAHPSADAAEVREYYEKVLSGSPAPDVAASRLKCLYDGDIHLTDRMAEITLRQVRGNDVAHILMHNRAASSSDGKPYRGGLAAILSTSRGAEHMPCIQTGILMRGSRTRAGQSGARGAAPTSRCVLDYLQPELLASRIYLAVPQIELDAEIESIVDYMKALYLSGEEGSPIARLSGEDKNYCLKTFVEKKLTDSLRRNGLSYYKLSLEMDSNTYKMIQQAQ